MSTRAIIGIKREDGTIYGAWDWNDGFNIKHNLVRDFKTIDDVNFLLDLGMFNVIFSKEEHENYMKFCKECNIGLSEKNFIQYKKSTILQEKYHEKEKSKVYVNLEEALGQDIDVLYLFENGKWKTFKNY